MISQIVPLSTVKFKHYEFNATLSEWIYGCLDIFNEVAVEIGMAWWMTSVSEKCILYITAILFFNFKILPKFGRMFNM